jgi:uncharacterized protein YcfJ
MKNIFYITALAVALGGTVAQANQTSPVTNTHVKDFYRTEQIPVPVTQRICREVQVPTYYNQQGNNNNTANTIVGALIGGALGNQVGGGSGKDAMTVLGAIVGADVARNNTRRNNNVAGYQTQTQCTNETTYNYNTQTVYDYSIITFTQDNQTHRVRFIK